MDSNGKNDLELLNQAGEAAYRVFTTEVRRCYPDVGLTPQVGGICARSCALVLWATWPVVARGDHGTRGAPRVASRGERGAFLDSEFLADHNGLVAERGAHSVKPPELHALIERLFPRGPYLELFARRPRAGWDCYGDAIGGFVSAEDGRDAA